MERAERCWSCDRPDERLVAVVIRVKDRRLGPVALCPRCLAWAAAEAEVRVGQPSDR